MSSDDPDFRFYASFRDSPKRLALADKVGPRGVLALVDLWCWVRANRPTGDLKGVTDRAIETAARWRGKRGAFIDAIRQDWLDGDEGAYVVHGWQKRQGWAKASPARSQAGKVAAIVKQARRHGVTTDQWLDDVGGDDSRNPVLRERAREASNKGARKARKSGASPANRSRIVAESFNDHATNGAKSLPLVSTPSPSPSPSPSPTGGGGGGKASPAAAPHGGAAGLPPSSKICAECGCESSGPSAIRLVVVDGVTKCDSCAAGKAEACPECGALWPADERVARQMNESASGPREVVCCAKCGGWSVKRMGVPSE